MNTAYTDLKPAYHLDSILAMRAGAQIVPSQIQLIISDLCNHDCSFCAYRMSGYTSNERFGEMTAHGLNNNPNRKIPTEKCIEILDDAALLGVRAVQFTGGGEPTVHTEHIRIFQHALSNRLDCALVTNGNRLEHGWDDVLPRFKWVRVSLDAGNAETYSRIRRVPQKFFQKAIDNIEEMVRMSVPVGVSFVATRENKSTIAEAARRVQDAGAKTLRIAAMFSESDDSYYDADDLGVIRSQIAAATEAAHELEIIDQFGSRLADLRNGSPDYDFCGYQQFNVYIGGDQKVYRCCNTAYSRMGEVGDLKSMSFGEFWASPEKRAAYGEFDARACRRCAFNNKNKVINYLVGNSDPHINFV